MKKNIIATLLGFIATFIANTVLAMTIIGPFLNAKIGISRDPVKDGLNFPAILFPAIVSDNSIHKLMRLHPGLHNIEA